MSATEKPLSTDRVLKLTKLLVEQSAKAFVEVWNNNNTTDKIDFRFVQSFIESQSTGKVQTILQFELKRDLMWTVLSRTIGNAPSKASMEMNLVLLTTELWRDMFVEITHLGFVSAIGLSEKQTKQPTDNDQDNRNLKSSKEGTRKKTTVKKLNPTHSKKDKAIKGDS